MAEESPRRRAHNGGSCRGRPPSSKYPLFFFFFDGCLWGLLNHCNSKKKNQPQTTTLGIRISVSCLLFLCLIYHAVHCSRVNFVTFNFRFRVPRSRIIYTDCTDLICIGYEIKRRTGRKNSIKSGRCLSGYVD